MMSKHPAAIAWDAWLASDAGKAALHPYDFTPVGKRQYLENRLARAFMAGYDAACPPPPVTSRSKRIEKMVAMRREGKCLKSIAAEFHVSRQRVHQILKAAVSS